MGLKTEREAGEVDAGSDCRALWLAVIEQALVDRQRTIRKGYRGMEDRNARDEAVDWLKGGSKDFHYVCQMAGLDADYVQERLARR